jgi:hypothetical protein
VTGKTGTAVRFERGPSSFERPLAFIGDGFFGGKAAGLAAMQETIASGLGAQLADELPVETPRLVVITTELFDAFMAQNPSLGEVLAEEAPDARIAHAFLRAELPMRLLGDLRALAERVRVPLAVRSSSLLEDALGRPLAGVYATKMTPNNQPDADGRFRALTEAIKLVYASTFFAEARAYRRTMRVADADERMAVIVQEVVGRRFGKRFYPHVSGVARSFNYYATGHARPEDGVVVLALGLGKTIVDGEAGWAYSPAYPKAPPPVNSVADLVKQTQSTFWAVNLGAAPYDPGAETEHMVRAGLPEAEEDGTTLAVASTFDAAANRLTLGAGAKGPRVVTFAPILQYGLVPLNEVVRGLLAVCERVTGGPVEVEFAVSLGGRGERHRLGFLQVRPLVAAGEATEVQEEEMEGERVIAAGERVLGNGRLDGIEDVVMMRRERFHATNTTAIANEVGELNARLVTEGRPYLLVGFGRWGTSDPWGGIPVRWAQISGARAIVEASLPELPAELSQGSHFFHNLTSFGVLYFSLRREERLDWDWLEGHPARQETEHLRWLRLERGLEVRADGRTGRGVIVRHD